MFIARQPIFNSLLKVYGYELLYRDTEKSTEFGNVSASKATAGVLGGLFEVGIEKIVDGGKAFVNCDYEFLVSDLIELIDPTKLIIEVLEDIKVDEKLIERLQELKKKGYKIALDDFVEEYDTYPIVPMADIIKYDIIATPLDSIKREVDIALCENKILLAEKIERKEEYEKAKAMGFNLFQGYFFSKPSIISKQNDKKTTKLHYARLISELKKPEPSYQNLAEIIETDVNLAYRLLRMIKNRQTDDIVDSIKRALIFMGFKEIERWINILMLQDLSIDKPMELTKLALTRSKLGEIIADRSKFKSRRYEVSMMCLFSTLDAILDQPMEKTLEGIEISKSIKQALIYKKGEIRPILNLILAYERGDWAKVQVKALEIEIDKNKLCELYLQALKWSKEIADHF